MTEHHQPATRTPAADLAATLLDRVREHAELFRADADASDRSGSIDPRVTEALRAAGGFGLITHPDTGTGALVRVGIGLATQHPTAAWNWVVSSTNQQFARQFCLAAGWELEPNPDRLWCGVFASPSASATTDPDRPGDHLVTGVWPYASNSDWAQWAVLNVVHDDIGAAVVLIPRSELSVSERWDAIGLRGSGSHTLAAQQLRVPASRLLPVSEVGREDPSGPFALRTPARLRTALGLAAVAAGAARQLLDAVIDDTAARPVSPARAPGTPGGASGRPGFAISLGEADSRIRVAARTLIDVADALDVRAEAGDPHTATQLTEDRLLLGRAARDLSDAVHELSLIAGSRAGLMTDPVGRAWRDAHIAVRHAALAPAVGFHLGGLALLGPESSSALAAAGPLSPGQHAPEKPAQGRP